MTEWLIDIFNKDKEDLYRYYNRLVNFYSITIDTSIDMIKTLEKIREYS